MNGKQITITGVIAAISAVAGLWLFVDDRFVHASEYDKQQARLETQIVCNERSRLEDEVLKLSLIPIERRTTQDTALLDRYRTRLKKLDNRICL